MVARCARDCALRGTQIHFRVAQLLVLERRFSRVHIRVVRTQQGQLWLLGAVSLLLAASGCERGGGTHVAVTSGECVVCHLDDYQMTTAPSHVESGFATTCADCHSTSAWIPALGGQADRSDPARDLVVDTEIPIFSGTSIATITPQTQTLTNPMRHGSAAIDASARASCTNCHSGIGSLYPGTFHASLIALSLPQPTTCNDCHAPSTMPSGFVGPDATSPVRVPSSAEMRHEAVLWADGAPTTTAIVTEDCSTCHAPPSDADPTSTWANGTFHASLDRAAVAQPSSCLDCHASSRPDHPIDSTSSSLSPGQSFDHQLDGGMGDCVGCHTSTTTWAGGAFHRPGDALPTSCATCHDGQRPTSDAGWTSPGYRDTPFDYGTNPLGVTHGDGQDCITCHTTTSTWTGGHFTHAMPGAVDAATCVACHATQRPDLVLGSASAASSILPGNFDHALNGTGDCFGCHQASVEAGRYAAYFGPGGTLPGGDWMGGTEYPGSFVTSTSVHVTVAETTLHRTGSLVTSMTTASTAYYSGMLHTSTAVPSEVQPGSSPTMPDYMSCWHCHTSTGTMVTSYIDGQFHASLRRYAANPGDPPAPLAEPTQCNDCHVQMRPHGIVMRGGDVLAPMDHAATFTAPVSIGGVTASGVADLDCSVCHAMPGTSWADGAFHANIGAAQPADCTTCHYPAMADGAHADLTSGTDFAMRHRSVQMTFQNCTTCHTSSLGRASTAAWSSWTGGAYHSHLTSAPTGCVDCHAISPPAGATRSGSGQYMSHRARYVTGRDCVGCHASDATRTPLAWSTTTAFHATVSTGVTTCTECHGSGNGLAAPMNNLPTSVTTTSFVTSASAATGVAGQHDQMDHADLNASGRDCAFCHTQTGPAAGPNGWAHARVHGAYDTARVAMTFNTTTGRCSHCHTNVMPTPAFTLYDHRMIGTSDCSGCHSWPGTGTAAMANWLGAMGGAPATLSVGGFTIPAPPAATPTMQPAVAGIAHPVTGSTPCTTCHGASGGGRSAIGYDHSPIAPIARHCNACHEAGSDLVSPVWNGTSMTGDTRPFTLASVRATYSGNSRNETYPNHFYPVDCDECHNAPTGVATGTTGTAFTSAWRFDHACRSMTPVTTCRMCHTRTTCE